MKPHSFIPLVMTLFVCVACGDAPNSHPEEKSESTEVEQSIEPPIPEYEITADGVECKNKADITETTTPDECTTTLCTWLCADYKNKKPVNVSITFRGCGDELPEVFSENIQTTKPVVCEAIPYRK